MKKVLIISYYWPPAGGVSVHRSLKIAKYLVNFNWEPIIFTAKNPDYPYLDDNNLKNVSANIKVLRHSIWEPFGLFKKLTGRKSTDSMNSILHVRDSKMKYMDKLGVWIRGNFFIPDARAMWIKPASKYLINYLKENPVDAIFSTGPPHSSNMIACNIRSATKIPWLADFQDPWTQADYYKLFNISKWAHKKHKRLEQKVFKYADKITIVSPSWKNDLESIGAKGVEVVYLGYDEEDFNNLTQNLDNFFTITHVGLIGFDRNPINFFKVLGELKNELPEFGKKLKIQLAGQFDYEVIKALRECNLESNIIDRGLISRKAVLQLIINSQLLLLLLNQASNIMGRLPGKMFEYLAAKRPILCFGRPESDAAKILKITNSGQCFDYDDAENIKDYILRSFNLFLDNKLNNNELSNNEYSVITQVKKIGNILDSMIYP